MSHVVALKFERLFRNAGDALSAIEQWDKNRITTHLINFMEGSSLDTRSPMGRIMIGIAATFAQFERDLCSQRTKDALQHKKSKREAYSPTLLGFVHEGMRLVEDTAK